MFHHHGKQHIQAGPLNPGIAEAFPQQGCSNRFISCLTEDQVPIVCRSHQIAIPPSTGHRSFSNSIVHSDDVSGIAFGCPTQESMCHPFCTVLYHLATTLSSTTIPLTKVQYC